MKDRIQKLLRYESISSSKFADEIGVQRSSISHIVSGRNGPSLDLVQKILNRYRNLSAEWLLFGRGEMYKDNVGATTIFKEEHFEQENKLVFENVSSVEENIEPEMVKETPKNYQSQPLKFEPSENEVEKIVVFYKEGRFKEYKPS